VERHTAHIFVDEWPPATVAEDVLWAQRPDGVFLTIDLNEAQDIKALWAWS